MFLTFVFPLIHHDCHNLLQTHLVSMFITRYILLAGVFNDVLKPYVMLHLTRWWRYRQMGPEESFFVLQTDFPEYGNFELNTDWLDVLLPLGIALFFGTTANLCMPMLVVVLLLQVRFDAWKLVTVYRRPYPRLVKDIGFFDTLLSFYGYTLIVSNLGILWMQFHGDYSLPPQWFGRIQRHGKSQLLQECFVYFFAVASLIVAWRFSDYVLPGKSSRLRLEQKRQALQRHRVWHRTRKDCMGLRTSMVDPSRQLDHMDFARMKTM